jgi:hypothetical protein
MGTPVKPKSGFEKWQDTIDGAANSADWDVYDCDIKKAVIEFNTHLASTPGYRPLGWQIVKAMAWVETGASSPSWKSNPMQIGVPGDPGLGALLGGKEGGDLIISPDLKIKLTVATATTMPEFNIRAAIGYLLMRAANFAIKNVPDATDQKIYEVKVKPGDSFDKLSRECSTTVETFQKLNPTARILHPGDVLKYQKAALRKVITGWKSLTTASIATLYNVGDPTYSKKLDYALSVLKQKKDMACAQ